MRFLRNKRRLVALGALGALVAGTLLVVLPALASNAGDYVNPPSSPGNVLPYDVAVGGTGACANLFTGQKALSGASEYDNVNPKTKTGLASGHNDGVTFDLQLSGTNQNQRLVVTGHNAAILGIGIKGGTHSTAYYYNANGGFVKSDGDLHAPLQSFTVSGGVESGSQFYSISQLTVCYTVLKYIEGTVYQDGNQNGSNDDSSPRSGWTVNLYGGVTAGTPGTGTLVDSQQTTASGSYHFDIPAAANSTYRVCEVPKAGDNPSNGAPNWVQDQPLPSTATLCNGSGELAKGYDVPSAQLSKSNADFGNVGGYSCSAAGAQVSAGGYTVGTCKAGQLYVFNSGTQNDAPFVDYWVGDPQANIPVVEQITFDDPLITNAQGVQVPKYTKLLYADGGAFPPTFNNLLTMPYCNLDPRDKNAGGYPDSYKLASPYDTSSSGVFPTTSPATTSCVISIRTTSPLPTDTAGRLVAYVYALGDSVRVGN